MTQANDIGARDPFSREALAERDRPMTTDAERAAVAREVQALEENGWVMLERVLDRDSLERYRTALVSADD